jgi:peptidoglycan/LPS O-acetylase OafA/YrhL
MSGYLIVASYDRSSSLPNYLKKRARRILPAYWATLVFSLILGTAFSRISAVEFWKSFETWKYIFSNFGFANFLHPTLPGLFLHNPGQPTVNGALWTIKIEVMFYLLVPGIVALSRRLGQWQVLSVIFFLSAIYRTLCEGRGHPSLATQLPGQLCYFAIGSLVYYYYSWFCRHRIWMWAIAISSYLAYLTIDGILLRAFSISFIVLCFAFLFPRFRGPTKYGDFSYGIYVFHCPIIQTLTALGLFQVYPRLAVAVALCSVAIISIASWNLIERPFLGTRTTQQESTKLKLSSTSLVRETKII